MRQPILRALFVPCFLAVPALFAVYGTEKIELHQKLNSIQNEALDPLFVYGTHLGDGLILILVALCLLFFKSLRAGYAMIIAGISSGAITQGLKRLVFNHELRPKGWMDEMPGLHIPNGVELASQFSFPSGHSTAAFTVCVLLSLILARPALSILLGAVAAFAAYSRVWISMHFMEDILAGALIGTATAVVVFHLFYERNRHKSNWNRAILRKRD